MCDYSLMALKNRLAVDGEELVVHKFEACSVGLASAAELQAVQMNQPSKENGILARIKSFLTPCEDRQCTAICIPPGARLVVRDIPVKLQREIGLHNTEEEVVFTEISAVGFRDAFRFRNGVELLLQRLKEGQRVKVLSVNPEYYPDPMDQEWNNLSYR